MSNDKNCSCEAKLLALEKEIDALWDSQNYVLELIENLTMSVNGCYNIEDEDLY